MKLNLILTLALSLSLLSCSNQSPSERVEVWGDDTDTTAIVGKVTMSRNQVLVPFKRLENGLAEVQVMLNGVPFNMWWDTGASVTCISLLELEKLAKEQKIDEDDYSGSQKTQIADGSISESAEFIIRELYIKGKGDEALILNDIKVLVSPNQNAPLLIGQNVIQALPKHSFNESTEEIEFDK